MLGARYRAEVTEPADRPARREQPTKPLDVDGVAATTYGTILWAAALVVLLVAGVRPGDSNDWWLWTCVAGIVLGVAGIAFTRRRAAVYTAHAARAGAAAGGAER